MKATVMANPMPNPARYDVYVSDAGEVLVPEPGDRIYELLMRPIVVKLGIEDASPSIVNEVYRHRVISGPPGLSTAQVKQCVRSLLSHA